MSRTDRLQMLVGASGGSDKPVRVYRPDRGFGFADLQHLWEYRDMFFFLVLRDIKVLYKQTVLGFGWAILRPVLAMIVFTVIFGRWAKIPSDGIPYPLFSYAALVPWTYVQTAMTASATSLVTGSRLVTKVYFPRVILPLVAIVSGLLDFVIAFAVVFVLMAYFGVAPNSYLLALPILILTMTLFSAGVGLWLSSLAVKYRDVKFALPFVAQLLMYAAPVVWPTSLIPEQYRLAYGLYPMAGVIEGFRSALLGSVAFPWDLVGVGAAVSLVLFVTGLAFFHRFERYAADVA
jgi:lipopolysaccharide transport system permease protein